MSDDFLNFMQGCFVNFVFRLKVLGGVFQVESYENTPNAYDSMALLFGLLYHDLFSLHHTS